MPLSLRPTTQALAKKATKNKKEQFTKRVDRKMARRQAKGLPLPVYYTTSVSESGKKSFSGGSALKDTATYPAAFFSSLFRQWKLAYDRSVNQL